MMNRWELLKSAGLAIAAAQVQAMPQGEATTPLLLGPDQLIQKRLRVVAQALQHLAGPRFPRCPK